jgi:hypothetical protein
MLAKYQFTGTTGGGFTHGNDYYVLAFLDGIVVFLDDSNAPHSVNANTTLASDFSLVSITAPGVTQIYP